MRKYLRDKIIELIPTVLDGINIAIESKPQTATEILINCFSAVKSIDESLSKALSVERYEFYEKITYNLKALLENLNTIIINSESTAQISADILEQFSSLKFELNNELEITLEVVFMPYKVSMWDSLESIWKAADEDPRCNAYVLPVPYCDRNPDHSLGNFHYEGDKMPKYVQVTHYNSYDINVRRPDAIFIHNPYDGCNYVTSVDPKYYSCNLKKSTDMLVYVPYFVSGAYNDLQSATQMCRYPAIKNADRVILQSILHKEIFNKCMVDSSKLIPLGSPKIDAALNCGEHYHIPDMWKTRIDKKKAFLLNTSIEHFLVNANWFEFMNSVIQCFKHRNDSVLIWRPHPLFESTVKSMRPQMMEQYMHLKAVLCGMDNIIYDDFSSAYYSILTADAMISDYSSLMMQFIATGKPVLNITGSKRERKKGIIVFDYFSDYFLDDGITINRFVDMILNNEDPKYKQRMSAMRMSLLNSDGKCGAKVYESIKHTLLSKRN